MNRIEMLNKAVRTAYDYVDGEAALSDVGYKEFLEKEIEENAVLKLAEEFLSNALYDIRRDIDDEN